MGFLRAVLGLFLLVGLCLAVPRRGRSQSVPINFLGQTTNELSTAILQSYVDDNSNLAFSPLGYSVILGILAEGAKGSTRTQLASALKLPEDSLKVRNTFQEVMKRLKNTNEYKNNAPEFKNWFYVYKNYTINDDYRKILEEYYLTDVKSVERYDSSFFQIKKESPQEEKEEEEEEAVEKVEQIDPMPSVEIKDPVVRDIVVPNAENIKKSVDTNAENKEEVKKDEIENVKGKEESDKEKIITFAMEDKPDKLVAELYDKHDLIKPGKNIKEKIKLANTFPKKHELSGSDFEIMEAVEARNHMRTTKSLFRKDDVNSLSANRVTSRDAKDATSIMILFNGLYYRGTWKIPFEKDENRVFYKSSSEKVTVPMMKSFGKFKTGPLPGLDSVALELPYEGDRYALLIVVPNGRDGLRRAAADLDGFPPAQLPEMLLEKELKIRIPSYYVEVTTKPIAGLAKFGVSSIFSPEADLSGISSVDGLFVQEMVQHVSVKVDEGGQTQSQFAVADPSVNVERSNPIQEDLPSSKSAVDVEPKVEEFVVDKPFLFFIRDVVENIVVLAGKVTDPVQADKFE